MSRMSAALARPPVLVIILGLSCMVVAVHAPGSGASLHGLQWACIASAAQLSHAGVPPSRGCLSMAACAADMVRDAQLVRFSSPSIRTYDICVTQAGQRACSMLWCAAACAAVSMCRAHSRQSAGRVAGLPAVRHVPSKCSAWSTAPAPESTVLQPSGLAVSPTATACPHRPRCPTACLLPIVSTMG